MKKRKNRAKTPTPQLRHFKSALRVQTQRVEELMNENDSLRSFANYLLGDDCGPDLDAYLGRHVSWPSSLSTVNYQKRVLEDQYSDLGSDVHVLMREVEEHKTLAMHFKSLAAILCRDGGQEWDLAVSAFGVDRTARAVEGLIVEAIHFALYHGKGPGPLREAVERLDALMLPLERLIPK